MLVLIALSISVNSGETAQPNGSFFMVFLELGLGFITKMFRKDQSILVCKGVHVCLVHTCPEKAF